MPDRLLTNQSLSPNQSLTSANGSFRLTLQTDGNLVIYATATNKSLWASNTENKFAVGHAIMQPDGNFVLYDNSNSPLWASNTAGKLSEVINPFVVMQNDGNLVIYATTDVWATNTAT